EAGVPVEQPHEVRLEQAEQQAVRLRPRRGRADDLVEEGDLAEEVAVGELDELAAGGLALDGDGALGDDVHPEPGLPLREDRLAGDVLPPVEEALERGELAPGEVLEERDAPEDVLLLFAGAAEDVLPEAAHGGLVGVGRG